MKFKIWHLFVFLTLISVALASYISFSRTIFTHAGVGSVRSAGHYTVGCDVIHDEMLDSFAHLGYSQVERPEWADAAKVEEYRDDGVLIHSIGYQRKRAGSCARIETQGVI